MRLLLTALGTTWVSAVAVVYVMLPTWVGLNTIPDPEGSYWPFGCMLAVAVGAVPFVIYLGARR